VPVIRYGSRILRPSKEVLSIYIVIFGLDNLFILDSYKIVYDIYHTYINFDIYIL
jgi:hypothetical protein